MPTLAEHGPQVVDTYRAFTRQPAALWSRYPAGWSCAGQRVLAQPPSAALQRGPIRSGTTS